MAKKHTEERLEDAIVAELTSEQGGYVEGLSDAFDPDFGLEPEAVLSFIRAEGSTRDLQRKQKRCGQMTNTIRNILQNLERVRVYLWK